MDLITRISRQSRLLWRVLALGGVHGVTLLAGVVSAVLWTRFMPQELYGEYKVVLSVVGFVGTFCYLGIGPAALMSATRGFDGNFAPLVKIKLLANLLGAIAILLAAAYYGFIRTESNSVALGLLAAALFFPAFNLIDAWLSWLNGKARFRELSTGRIGISLISPGSLLFVTFAGVNGLWAIVAITFAATGCANLLMLQVASRQRATELCDQPTISYSHHAAFALSFGAILSLDAAILEHFHGSAEVAVYAAALLLPDQLKAGYGIINQALAPKMYGPSRLQDLLKELRPIFFRLSVASVAIAVLGFLLFPFVITVLFSNKYAVAGEIGKWLWLFAALTAPINSFLGAVAVSRQHAGRTYVGSIGYSIVLIGFCLLFLNEGAAGFVSARIATYAVTAVFHLVTIWWLLRKESRTIGT